ncbi:hypothetical protein D3C74_326770 [compost metagenome]
MHTFTYCAEIEACHRINAQSALFLSAYQQLGHVPRLHRCEHLTAHLVNRHNGIHLRNKKQCKSGRIDHGPIAGHKCRPFQLKTAINQSQHMSLGMKVVETALQALHCLFFNENIGLNGIQTSG